MTAAKSGATVAWEIDRLLVEAHVRMIHALAEPLAGRGKLVVAGFGENAMTGQKLRPKIRHFAIGDIDGMIAAVERLAREPHRNIYASLAVFRTELHGGRKGEERDIIAMLGLIQDFDDDRAGRCAQRLPTPAQHVMQTSFSRYQTAYLFDRPEPPAVVKPVAARLRAFAGCDPCSIDLSHVWRIPGCHNWPTANKLAAGRSAEP
jgi:hypothetical protein